ncbi:MAG: hypothetical protein CMH49_02960 [Myxococcales bacterium]|nr:hypothetical protein [Myxococcales bacterium]
MSKEIVNVESQIRAGIEIMLSGVRGIPEHLSQGAKLAEGIAAQLKHEVKRITLCALGGSAFPGDLLRVITDPLGVPLQVSRSYEVAHARLNKNDLVIACSFSGNTEESLSSFDDALKRGAQIMIICAGGQLEKLANQHQLPFIKLTKPTPTFQPRAASGFFIGALSALLEDLGYFEGARNRLSLVAQELKTLMDVKEEAQKIASELNGSIPVFYAPPPYAESLARVVKIKINENAKSPAFWNEVPEFNHNEMVGYTRLHESLTAVFFEDPLAKPRMQTRINQSAQTLSDYGVKTLKVAIRPAQDRLSSLLATLYLFDVVSCEMALQAGVDPNPVAMVEDFKAALGLFESLDQA